MDKYEEMQKLKIMEINSAILSELSYRKAPMWVRPAMIWEERWNRNEYTAEKAIQEAKEKIKLFIPLCSGDSAHLEYLRRSAT